MKFREKLATRANAAGISVENATIEGLEAYFELLRRWNRTVSLTSLPINAFGDEALDRLLVEPLVASRHIPLRDAAIIDIGTGGGSPAIPIKIANPGVSMRMVESKARKAAFLREVVRHLELSDTDVETARFEDLLGRQELREAADVVTLRAVKTEPESLATLQAFLKPGGSLMLFRTTSRASVDYAPLPFVFERTYPLIPTLNSELAIFTKAR